MCTSYTATLLLLIERKRGARTWMKWKMHESHIVASAGQTPQPQSHLLVYNIHYFIQSLVVHFCVRLDEWVNARRWDIAKADYGQRGCGDWAESSSCASSGAESHARPRALTRPAHATPWRRQIESTRTPHHAYFSKYLAERGVIRAHILMKQSIVTANTHVKNFATCGWIFTIGAEMSPRIWIRHDNN